MSFGRVLTAMVTPMHQDGAVNLKEAARLAKHLAQHGSDGIVVAGSTGESPSLSVSEKVELFRTVREAVGPDVYVVAGTGTNSTATSAELTREAEKVGVDGVMLVVPYYNKPTQEGLYRHFRQIADQVSVPIMLYNVPGRTSQNMLPETVARLANDAPNITAIKEASGNLEQASWIRRLTPERFTLYSGDDVLTLPMLSIGAYGVVSVASHVVGDSLQEMIRAFVSRDLAAAARIHGELLPILKTLFVTTNPIPVKVAMRRLGWDVGSFRLPLCEPTQAEITVIEQALRDYGLI